jgi:hypothetical protein
MLRRLMSTLEDAAVTRNVRVSPLIVVIGATGTGKSQVCYPILTRTLHANLAACCRSSYEIQWRNHQRRCDANLRWFTDNYEQDYS